MTSAARTQRMWRMAPDGTNQGIGLFRQRHARRCERPSRAIPIRRPGEDPIRHPTRIPYSPHTAPGGGAARRPRAHRRPRRRSGGPHTDADARPPRSAATNCPAPPGCLAKRGATVGDCLEVRRRSTCQTTSDVTPSENFLHVPGCARRPHLASLCARELVRPDGRADTRQ